MTAYLVAFLHARLDERERWARAAKAGPWHADGGSVHAAHPTDAVIDYCGDSAEHIACHDPARVLRDVAAWRAILAAFRIADVSGEVLPDDRNIGEADGLEEALRHLAAVYDDHPDYRPE